MIIGQVPAAVQTHIGRSIGRFLGCGLLCCVVAACSYRGDIEDPLTIKATWFSYLNGDDIRQTCSEGSELQYRLVYNADYDEQLRSYELTGDGAGGATLTARVQGRGGILVNNRFDLSDPFKGFRWTTSETALDSAAQATLDEALRESGAFEPAPAGLRLFSKETYWVSSLCKDGVFYFNAWLYPSERYDALTFDEILFGHDATEIAVRAPQAIPAGERFRFDVPRRREVVDDRGSTFDFQVGKNGLEGYVAL